MKDKPVILVVDDQPQDIELLEAYLVPQGYEIVKAANGEEALGKLSGNHIDLILMDILMPGMDGLEVARRIRRDHAHCRLPIILITALQASEDRVKGIEAGCNDFLSKPFDKMELFARVRSLLQVKAYNDLVSDFQIELEAKLIGRTEELRHTLKALQQEITRQKLAEEALRNSEEKYRLVVDNMADVISVTDMNMRFTYQSPSIFRLRGLTSEEAMEQTVEQVLTPDSLRTVAGALEEEMAREADGKADPGRTRILELQEYRKDGSVIWVENHMSFIRDEAKKPVGIISVSHDITARKQAEEMLLTKTMLLEAQSETSIDGILAVDREGRVILVNKRFGDLWKIPQHILDEKDHALMLKYISKQLKDPEAFNLKVAHLYEHPKEQSRDEVAFTDGRAFDRYSSPLLSIHGQNLGRIWFFRDITESKRSEENLQQALESLRKALGTTIQVLVSASEVRDPYTAGHQQRVADLSCAIAMEMGFTRDRADGLRMAGVVHDIGKLSVPSEILSKPTKLTTIEFALIKEHARSGYEMLKDVASPWPLAEVAYQHHERMDGSGYPRSLKGEEILMEARIMAVSDVVESMASHRPYRPAIGIEAALDEIEKNKGTLYDAAVSDACLRLFREKGFQL